MNKNLLIALLCVCLPMMMAVTCGGYSFSDASTDPNLQTVKINFFQNEADVVNPTLSQAFTERLRSKIQTETNLRLVDTDDAHIVFNGAITQYTVQPVAASAGNQASLNQLRISVRVEFFNNVNDQESWVSTFTKFENFESNVNFSSVEASLVNSINDQLVDDIFNRAFVNW